MTSSTASATTPVDEPHSIRSYFVCGASGTSVPRCHSARNSGAGWLVRDGNYVLEHCLQRPHLDLHNSLLSLTVRSAGLHPTKSLGMGDPMRRYRRSSSRWYRDVLFHAAPGPLACADHFRLRQVATSRCCLKRRAARSAPSGSPSIGRPRAGPRPLAILISRPIIGFCREGGRSPRT